MVERLCRLVGHGDGAQLSERGSLEFLQKDLGSLIATTRNVPRGCKRLPSGSGKSSRYAIPNENDKNALSNVMKDQPMISSASRTSNDKLVLKKSE